MTALLGVCSFKLGSTEAICSASLSSTNMEATLNLQYRGLKPFTEGAHTVESKKTSSSDGRGT